jgi:hypothetical protein
MADKIKPGISVRTTFVDGESPKAAKLNSLSSQLQNASQRLEAVIGDIHSESYPYSSLTSVQLSPEYGRDKSTSGALVDAPTRALDIATLGRLIGPAANLNPHELGSQELTETVPAAVHEFALVYPPDDPSLVTFSDTAVFADYKTAVSDLDGTGDYYIDDFGKVYTVDETNGGTVTYTYDPTAHAGGNSYQDSSFNVIPDVNQLETGSGCSVGALDANGRRPITLPIATHHHYNQSGTSVELTVADPAYLQQLYLPKVLVDNWSSEEEIPGGFLYVKNYTKNKIYKNATYYYNSSTSVLIGGEDITDDVDAGDVFCIITVGTDITTAIDDLRRKLRHSHDRSFGESLVPVEALSGILSAAGNSGVFVPSEIPGNFFPQYLHRDGYNSTLDSNKNDNNILRGDLALGVSTGSAGSYGNLAGPSFKLKFLGTSVYPQGEIWRDSSFGLVIDPDQQVLGDYYLDAETQGVRIRNGHLVPEKGMMSGLNGSTPYEFPLQMMNLMISDSFDTSTTGQIDLANYGLDLSKHFVTNVHLLLGLTSSTIVDSVAAGVSNLEYGYSLSNSTNTISLYFTGSVWGSTTTLYVNLVVFFYELASV